MNEFNVLLAAATNGTPSGSLFDALFVRYIAPQESWRELESPLPITILAAGEDLIDYRIYGNTVQNGTPTPENPITPEGVGERTENLFDKNQISDNSYINSSGIITYGSKAFVSDKIPVFENKEYCLQSLEQTFIGGYYVAFYDEQDNALSVRDPRNQNSVILTAPIGSKYFRLSGNRNVTLTTTTFTEGSTAPTSYIPYGYKLPMVSRTANLFDVKVEQGGWDAGNGAKPSKYGMEKPDFYYIRCRCDSVYAIDPEKQYTISIFPKTFQILVKQTNLTGVQIADTGWGNDWTVTGASGVCFSIRNPTNSEIIPSDIQGVTITAGSTAPTEYIPYYRDEENIYIGSDPLVQDEYVDYGEQKIYRMVNGTLTPTDPPVPIPALPTIEGETIIDYNPSTTPAVEPEKMYIKYKP